MKPRKTRQMKLLYIVSAFVLCLGIMFTNAVSLNKINLQARAGECPHTHVEHYPGNANYIEHWACCECHTAWKDENLTEVIGNTISNRTNIDVPYSYSYNAETNKIEYGRKDEITQYLTPNQ